MGNTISTLTIRTGRKLTKEGLTGTNKEVRRGVGGKEVVVDTQTFHSVFEKFEEGVGWFGFFETLMQKRQAFW